ncbi:MAG: hypothetical protein WB440_13685 [Steroidobacteraceae bacterium]
MNTDFDPIAGHIRYVYVLPKVMTTVITLRLREHQATTDVQVRMSVHHWKRPPMNESGSWRGTTP